MDYEKKIDIPFGAHDSELKGWEYTIPEGMEAIIKDGKVIVREKESEEERIRKELINFILYKAKGVSEEQEHSWVGYLEKQKEQKPAEWSEKDKLMRTVIIQTLERFGGRGTTGMQIDWLKSLRPQPHWKPSEEQMEALARATNRCIGVDDAKILVKLLEQLEKL